MTEPSHAVFLSYASQDTEAAQRICEALRAAGIEVWFDQSELRGGDVWDQKIRHEIHDCALFMPVISQHTQERLEGYFRREWKLAIERTHDMAEQKHFLVPVVIDSTVDRDAIVPELFRTVQWTRLPAGQAPPAFVDRIKRLLSPEPSTLGREPARAQSSAVGALLAPARAAWSPRRGLLLAVALVVLAAVAYFAIGKFWISQPAGVSSPTVAVSAAPAAFAPPAHSIAVLPFVNMSGEKEQEYFSDGMTEELIASLSRVSSLKVIARTSSFAFKGRNVQVAAIARTLNVGSILEGSVRRAGSKVRVTVQLISGRDGFHVWSQGYDRNLKNILALQSDIATAVAQELKAKLLGDEPAKIQYGGTSNADAYDAFLQANQLYWHDVSREPAIRMYERAVQLDSGFARAWTNLASAYLAHSDEDPSHFAEWLGHARVAGETALRLAPRLSDAHGVMAFLGARALDWTSAEHEVEAAAALDPNAALNARGNLYFQLGRWPEAIEAARTAIALDPLVPSHRFLLASALSASGQNREAELAMREIVTLKLVEPAQAQGFIAQAVLYDHRPADALAEAERVADKRDRDSTLAMIYYALGRHQESDRIMAAYERQYASEDAFGIAQMHAYRGETDLAFQWLDRAVRQHDPALFVIKGNIAQFPNVTSDARYRELLRRIGFPVP